MKSVTLRNRRSVRLSSGTVLERDKAVSISEADFKEVSDNPQWRVEVVDEPAPRAAREEQD